jgi:hypothetical protein
MGRREDRSGAPRTAPRTIARPDRPVAVSQAEALPASGLTAPDRCFGVTARLRGRAIRLLLVGAGLVIAFWAFGALSQARADVLPPGTQRPAAIPALAHPNGPVAVRTGARLLHSTLGPRTVTRPRPVHPPAARTERLAGATRRPLAATRPVIPGGSTRTSRLADPAKGPLAAVAQRHVPLTGGTVRSGPLAGVKRPPVPASVQRITPLTRGLLRTTPLAGVATDPLPVTVRRLIADGVTLTRVGLSPTTLPLTDEVRGRVRQATAMAVKHRPYSPPRIGPGCPHTRPPPPPVAQVSAPPPAGTPGAASGLTPADADVPVPVYGPVASAPLRLKATGTITHGQPRRQVRVGPLTPVPAPVSGSSGSDSGGSKTSGGAGDVPRLRLPTCGLWSISPPAPPATGRNVADEPSFSPD